VQCGFAKFEFFGIFESRKNCNVIIKSIITHKILNIMHQFMYSDSDDSVSSFSTDEDEPPQIVFCSLCKNVFPSNDSECSVRKKLCSNCYKAEKIILMQAMNRINNDSSIPTLTSDGKEPQLGNNNIIFVKQ
jgi:protein-arginine kinase activator protein McsA